MLLLRLRVTLLEEERKHEKLICLRALNNFRLCSAGITCVTSPLNGVGTAS